MRKEYTERHGAHTIGHEEEGADRMRGENFLVLAIR